MTTKAALVNISEAIRTTLVAATLSQSFTPVRSWFPVKKLEDYGSSVYVFIYPDNVSSVAIQDRDGNKKQFEVIVTVGKKITAEAEIDNDDVDPLILLIEEIDTLFFHAKLKNTDGDLVAFCDGSKFETVANIEALGKDSRVFSAITFTFTDYQEQI